MLLTVTTEEWMMRKTTKSRGEKIDKEIKCATRKHYSSEEKIRIVLENRHGEVVVIEVQSSATVSAGDFSRMRELADARGKKFVQCMVLYDRDQVVPFKKMFAAQLSCLWSGK